MHLSLSFSNFMEEWIYHIRGKFIPIGTIIVVVDTGIGVNSTGFLAAKSISWLVFLVCAKSGVRHWKCGRQTLWLI